jgi:voltage-gated potassium channel
MNDAQGGPPEDATGEKLPSARAGIDGGGDAARADYHRPLAGQPTAKASDMTTRKVKVPFLRRSLDRFASDPGSVRNAAAVMIVATVGIVLIGALVVWAFDRSDFPDLGSAVWYTLQTVTTVGYGDKVPTNPVGRLVGAVVMVVAVALVAIVTASITSTFVEAAQRRRRAGQETQAEDSVKAMDSRLDEIVIRLTAIERSLEALGPGRPPATGDDRTPEDPRPV